jgi:hypothetical protein
MKEGYLEKFWNRRIRRKGRSRNSWIQEVRTGMREKGIDIVEWIDRKEWRRKIKLLPQKDVKTLLLLFVNSTRHEIYRLNLNYKVIFHLIIIDLN